jgi:leucyl aminopeptidase
MSSSLTSALFSRKIEGAVLFTYENERPLQGVAGEFDWIFSGGISWWLKRNTVTGQAGEVVLIPMEKNNHRYPLLLVGMGASKGPGHRARPDASALATARRCLSKLGVKSWGVSRRDFGGALDSQIEKDLKGPAWEGTLWIAE